MPIDPRLGLAQKVLPTEGKLLARSADLDRRITALEQSKATNPTRVIAPSLSSISTYTFSGLNGDKDAQYRIGVSGVVTTGGADRSLSIRPNADATSWFDSKWRQDWWDTTLQSSQGEYRGAGFGWFLGWINFGTTYGANHFVGEMQIEARRISGFVRTAKTSWSTSPDALTERHLYGIGGGKWENQAANITSLVVHFGGGSFTGDIWLEYPFRTL